MAEDASFRAGALAAPALIGWDETGRDWLTQRMYTHLLGLDPPADIDALCARMNRLDNPWLRQVRARVEAARRAHAAGDGPTAPGFQGLVGGPLGAPAGDRGRARRLPGALNAPPRSGVPPPA